MLRDSHSRVLCVSRDKLLGETRQLVLQTRFSATLIYNLCDMASLNGSYDLIVLCHSLSGEECVLASVIARRSWPRVQVLALSIRGKTCGEGIYDQLLIGMPEPGRLLEKIGSMLRTSESDTYDAWLARSTDDWDFPPNTGQRHLSHMLSGKVLVH